MKVSPASIVSAPVAVAGNVVAPYPSELKNPSMSPACTAWGEPTVFLANLVLKPTKEAEPYPVRSNLLVALLVFMPSINVAVDGAALFIPKAKFVESKTKAEVARVRAVVEAVLIATLFVNVLTPEKD